VDFRIADTFTASLTRLTGGEQKAVKTTAFDLQLNPSSPGLRFHRLDLRRRATAASCTTASVSDSPGWDTRSDTIDLVLRLSTPVHDCRYERLDFRRRDVQAR
jgi:hypothetical protein